MSVTGALWITGGIMAGPMIAALIAWAFAGDSDKNRILMWLFIAFFCTMIFMFILATWSAVKV